MGPSNGLNICKRGDWSKYESLWTTTLNRRTFIQAEKPLLDVVLASYSASSSEAKCRWHRPRQNDELYIAPELCGVGWFYRPDPGLEQGVDLFLCLVIGQEEDCGS